MKKTVIYADSTCDFPKNLIERYNINIVPGIIIFGEDEKRDGITAYPDDILDYYDQKKELPRTAATPPGDYVDIFEKETKDGNAVIVFNMSSKISCSYANAVIAAENYEDVYVIDSQNLSTGIAYQVMDAAIMAENGVEAKKIAEKINEEKEKMNVSFIIDTLEFLRKGGRCSALAALGANLLKIKPCIEVLDGKMDSRKKYRGNLDAIHVEYINDRLEKIDEIDPKRIFITHSGVSEKRLDAIKKHIASFNHFEEIIENRAGCVVTTHCGRDTMGVICKLK